MFWKISSVVLKCLIPCLSSGFTNLPEFVPVLGELPLLPETFFSVELFARHFVPERNESLRFMLEEDAYWVDERQGWEFVRGRQERFHIVNATRGRTQQSRIAEGKGVVAAAAPNQAVFENVARVEQGVERV